MKILVVGGTGLIGGKITEVLAADHEVIGVSRQRSKITVDIAESASIRRMFLDIGNVDAVICTAGMARFVAWSSASNDDWEHGLRNKLMGQVNLVRIGADYVRDGGSFTLTSGVFAQHPMRGSTILSTVNAAVESFVRAASLELERGLRLNVVSPGWITETLIAMGLDAGPGVPAIEVAQRYKESVEGRMTGAVLDAVKR